MKENKKAEAIHVFPTGLAIVDDTLFPLELEYNMGDTTGLEKGLILFLH